MAPAVERAVEDTISDINVSSLELDVRSLSSLQRRSADIHTPPLEPARDASPLQARSLDLVKRAGPAAPQHGAGVTPPESINNAGFFALFAILGVGMVLAALWFFFWAKNGGFHFQEGDWDDYKSTVLRRKGPDGKTLSNATKSTKLGGGTIAGTQRYAWQKNIAKSVVGRDEKGRKGVLAKRGWGNTHSITYSDDTMTETFATPTVYSEMRDLRSEPDLEAGHHSRRYRDRDVRQYKKEKVARVGGLNRVADSSRYDSERSEIMTESAVSDNSSHPILPKSDRQAEKDRAERKAREEAARMERRWKREAEAAAAALARESAAPRAPPHKAQSPSKPSPSHAQKNRRDRSGSPKKRDFSYNNGPESEILSTAYTQSTSGTRTASYYDEYRPRASENPRYSTEYGRRTSGSPTKKKAGGGGARSGGYRRGGQDSDLE
ncbi:unnamed protein product [Zymoseptoria tritici ST99CH_3D7]|uniref:Endosomal spry domain-containing protein n=2 Tax=Zymoseptoria tritici TaxID=1047171 RepID=F9X5V9_ZYMTI|nr:uncharacterized protein MYCGRDRAFT_108817 [Zymoseptoria tritici IPO323]EGP89010.1 hypothetical protein MYCGRDRAFT_108817 [Zymoseptoria tritici IPO323]SMQ49249.1 unnamed protein product [Zymoseptoria tritici ST99CH_3D7]